MAMSTSRNPPSSPPSRCTTTEPALSSLFDVLLAETDAEQPDDADHDPGRLDQDDVEAVPQAGPHVALQPVHAARQELVPDIVQGEAATDADHRVVETREGEQAGNGDQGEPGDAQRRHGREYS